jgi:signal transduction histidine kinase
MRERFEAFAGRLDVRTHAGGGFEVHGVMPGEAPRLPGQAA